jgi:peroxiredoxin
MKPINRDFTIKNNLMFLKKCLIIAFIAMTVKSSICLADKQQPGKENYAIIKIKSEHLSKDSLKVMVFDNCYSSGTNINVTHREFNGHIAKDGRLTFYIPNVGKCSYLSLMTGGPMGRPTKYEDIATLYLLKPGDNIVINISRDTVHKYSKYNLVFTGRGSLKYKCKREMDLIALLYDSNPKYRLNVLMRYKRYLTNFEYQVLLANLKGEQKIEEIRGFSFKASLDHLDNQLLMERDSFPDNIIYSSNSYATYIVSRMEEKFYRKFPNDPNSKILATYNGIKSSYTGMLREKLLTIYVTDYASFLPDSIVANACVFVKSPFYKDILLDQKNTLTKGSVAYDFSLTDVTGHKVKLSDFKGKVVFMDFWFTGCQGCYEYYRDVLSKTEAFFKSNPGVVFLSVCVDKSKETWLKSVNSTEYQDSTHALHEGSEIGEYTSKDAINLYTEGQGWSHPAILKYKIQAYPSMFLIDRNGKIFSANVNELKRSGIGKLNENIEKALNNPSDKD